MRILLVVLVLAMLACCAISAQALQLVTNPGFESGAINGSWVIVTQPVTIDSTVAHTGTYSAKMSAAASFIYLDFPNGSLKPSTEYQFSIWIKCANADATLVVSVLPNDPITQAPVYVGLGTYDWTNVTFKFTTANNVIGGPIYFTLGANSMGQVWLDDATLTGPDPIADVVADWSNVNTTGSQWSCGFLPNDRDTVIPQGTFTPYTWDFAGSYWSTSGQTPWRGIADMYTNGASIFLAGGYWADKPDWDVYQSLGTIGWTAPSDGTYQIISSFKAYENSSKVFVIKKNIDGTLEYLNPNGSVGQIINGATQEVYTFVGNVDVLAGENIFFAEYNNKPGLQPLSGSLDNYVLFSSSVYSVASAGSSLSATVNLSNWVGVIDEVPVTIQLNSNDPFTTNLDADGKFTVLDLADGMYDVRIKASHWLAKFISGINVSGATDIGTITLTNGDVVDNNEVDFSDINAVRAAYGSFPGDDNWNDRADVDGSMEVDFTDINIVRSMYGEIGD